MGRATLAERVCPWWLGYLLACPWRRLLQDPHKIVASHVHEGMTVLEPGPGMGFFTLVLARLVGRSGRVVAVDIQPQMLDRLRRRAEEAGLLERLDVRLAQPQSMGLDDLIRRVDFVLAFAVVHEMPDGDSFFQQCAASLRAEGTLLLAEPSMHVNAQLFEEELEAAFRAGLVVADRPVVPGSRAALLRNAKT